MARRKKRSKKKQLSDEEQRIVDEKELKKKVISMFTGMGFEHLKTEGIDRGWPEEVSGTEGIEFDFVFVNEAVIIVYEITLKKDPDATKNHFRSKTEKYRRIDRNKEIFIKALKEKFPEGFREYPYPWREYQIFYIYHPKTMFNVKEDEIESNLKIISNAEFTYFYKNTIAIKKSAKYEMFDYLGLKRKAVVPHAQSSKHTFDVLGIISDHVTGIAEVKSVNFMICPRDILECAYVLRKGSWHEEENMYQRLLMESKLQEMREFISGDRSFVDSITVSLPDEIRFYKVFSESGDDFEEGGEIILDSCGCEDSNFVRMVIPHEYNSIGVIDGQHRIFAYHEAKDKFEEKIKQRRELRCLLVTGLVFPKDWGEKRRIQTESEIFCTLNSKQKKPDTPLLQHIEQYRDPYGKIGLGRKVLVELNNSDGPLRKKFEMDIDDDKKIKTASIVKYALSRIVSASDPDDENSFYFYWKENGMDIRTDEGYRSYIEYCVKALNIYFGAIKDVFSEEWHQENSKILTSLSLNGLILSLSYSLNLEKFYKKDFNYYKSKIQKLRNGNFSFDKPEFVSSQWSKLADIISDKCWSGYICKYPDEHKNEENQKLDQ